MRRKSKTDERKDRQMSTTKNIFEDFIDPLEENSLSPWLIS